MMRHCHINRLIVLEFGRKIKGKLANANSALANISNLNHSLYYVEASNEFCGTHLRDIAPGSTAQSKSDGEPFATLSDLAGQGFEPQASRTKGLKQ